MTGLRSHKRPVGAQQMPPCTRCSPSCPEQPPCLAPTRMRVHCARRKACSIQSHSEFKFRGSTTCLTTHSQRILEHLVKGRVGGKHLQGSFKAWPVRLPPGAAA